jgi:hypothetical protein
MKIFNNVLFQVLIASAMGTFLFGMKSVPAASLQNSPATSWKEALFNKFQAGTQAGDLLRKATDTAGGPNKRIDVYGSLAAIVITLTIADLCYGYSQVAPEEWNEPDCLNISARAGLVLKKTNCAKGIGTIGRGAIALKNLLWRRKGAPLKT